MANIDLRTIYRTTRDKISPVDSRIILNKTETDSEIYSDLKFDVDFNEIKERPLNAKENTRDLIKITNLEAVKVALKNIINTSYNSRLLNPEIDFNLRKYLFERLNTNTAYFIGYELCTKISVYEPRVKIENVKIELDFDNACYIVYMDFSVPSLNATLSLKSILSQDGFYFSN